MKNLHKLFQDFLVSDKFDVAKINSKTTIYRDASSNEKFATDYNNVILQTIKKLFKYKPSKTIREVLKCHSMVISDLFEHDTLTDFCFWIFGCPLSTDIDIAIEVSNIKQITMYLQKRLIIDMTYLHNELAMLGYDIDRELDICLIIVKDGKFIVSSKGSKETQNIIFSTYENHVQKFMCPFTELIKLHHTDKMHASIKTWLDKLEILYGTEYYYEHYRTRKSHGYHKFDTKVALCHDSMRNFALTEDASHDILSVIKTITMKLVQMILTQKDIYIYNKEDMASEFDKLYSGTKNALLYLLTRGKSGSFADTNEVLMQLFGLLDQCIANYSDNMVWAFEKIKPTGNPTDMSSELVEQFWISPLLPTKTFVSLFREQYPDGKFDHHTNIPCFGKEHVPSALEDQLRWFPQRSPEWHELLKVYTKTYTSPILVDTSADDWVESIYNLIRGCIVELYVINLLDIEKLLGKKYYKISTGYVISKDETEGFTPDLLLMDPDDPSQLIPVEVKCLPRNHEITSEYHRTFKLASSQLDGACKLLGSKKGLFIWVYVYINHSGSPEYDFYYHFYTAS